MDLSSDCIVDRPNRVGGFLSPLLAGGCLASVPLGSLGLNSTDSIVRRAASNYDRITSPEFEAETVKMKHLRWTGSALLALGMITGGCGPKSAASDQTLTTNIQSQLYADSTTRQANVNVAVKDGVVTLSGDVPSSDVELQAMKIANGTAGVRSVSDQMKVNGTMAANPMP